MSIPLIFALNAITLGIACAILYPKQPESAVLSVCCTVVLNGSLSVLIWWLKP